MVHHCYNSRPLLQSAATRPTFRYEKDERYLGGICAIASSSADIRKCSRVLRVQFHAGKAVT